MKKTIVASLVLVAVLGGAAVAYWLSQSDRRFDKHIGKARILLKQQQFEAAREEYKAAYSIKGGYSPHISEEVLRFEVAMMRKEGRLQDAIAETNLFIAAAGSAGGPGRMLLADLYLEARKFDSAFQVLEGLIAEKPEAIEPRAALARIRTLQGRHDLAEAQYRQMLRAHPDSIPVLLLLAGNLEQRGDQTERRTLLRKVLAKDGKQRLARLGLVDSWLREGRIDSARLALDDWGEVDTASQRDVALRKARIYCLSGRYDDALAAIRPHQDSTPASAPLDFEEPLILARQGKLEEAAALYENLARKHPAQASGARTMQALLRLARSEPAQALGAIKQADPALERPDNLQYAVYAYTAMGQKDKAAEALSTRPALARRPLEEFLAQAPADPRFVGGWARIQYFMAARLPSGALQAATDLRRAYPANPLPASVLALLYSELGRPDSAYRILSSIPDPSPEQRFAMSKHLLASGKADAARAGLERLRDAHPGMPGVNLLLGDAYQKLGKREESLAGYRRELELDTANLVALNNLAWELGVVRGDLAAARPYLERLEKAAFSDARVFDTIGWIYALNGAADKGEAFLKQALGLVPDNPALLYHMAYVLEKKGRKADARAHLERALQAPGEWPDKDAAKRLLASID